MNQLSLFDLLFSPQDSAREAFLPLVPKKEGPAMPGKKSLTVNIIPEKPIFQMYAEALADYIPAESLEDICNTLATHKVFLKITRKRHTKLGDYRSPHNGNGHRITVNHDLNSFSFLVTLIHELAHLNTWEKHKRRAKPHGPEWKNEFRETMVPFLKKKIFPDEIVVALNNYLLNPAASSCTDIHLLKTLRKFDKKNDLEKTVHLEDLPENSVFTLAGSSKTFRKGKKLRKRFLCMEVNSKRKYLVSPVAEVRVY